MNRIVLFSHFLDSCYCHFVDFDLLICLMVYTDASFNNLLNGGSQGGQIVFLCDESNNSCPLSWNSTRMKGVVHLTLAAETLSLVDGCETALYLLDVVRSVSMLGEDSCPDVISITDNESLFDAVHSTKLTLDRRLRLDISSAREMCEREVCLQWTETGCFKCFTCCSSPEWKNPITLNLLCL